MNRHVEQNKVIEHLNAALLSAQTLQQDLLQYLIGMALAEAREPSEGAPKAVLVRNGQRRRLL